MIIAYRDPCTYVCICMHNTLYIKMGLQSLPTFEMWHCSYYCYASCCMLVLILLALLFKMLPCYKMHVHAIIKYILHVYYM